MVDYKFLKIEDAIPCINQKVNLIAVILDFSLPQKSRGTDYFCKLKIIDESHPKYGIPVHLFAQCIGALPHVASVGDIIHLSRVMMKTHEGDVYAIFNKRFSSFALYEGIDGENFHPYQVSLRFHAREQDNKIIADLRKWLANSKVIDVSINFLLLREINEVDWINLACKVLHICKTAKDEWMVFLWDGTDAPPFGIYKKLEDEMQNQLPLCLEPMPLSRDVLCTFPTVGTILRVIINEDCRKYTPQLPKIGQWVKLFHVLCKVHEGLWYGVLTPSSKIRDIPNDNMLILERQSNYDHRLSCKLDKMPYWSFPWPSRITEVNCDDVPFATLMDVLMCRKAKFFNGYSSDALTQKLIKLLGVAISAGGMEIKGAARNPPWVQCCLKSHYLKCYKICDTKLVG
ncbi:protection of telomeres protein 1b-like isoform X2 [Durio zibethinus]|uniref:Protection of telomeres protein 1b-like isoform X2 n=1 Tax=Durio zibethinus TaxID=66656 RepID=A0A6P5YF36_DURZI|nr:protection of telomeres protein 1b-like isoform X2 [Durio zibethinus]